MDKQSDNADYDELFKKAYRKSLDGELFESNDLLYGILQQDPGNLKAQHLFSKNEQQIESGYFPIRLVPFDARVAYNAGQNLEKIGDFQAARIQFILALQKAQAVNNPMLQNWLPAFEALTALDQAIIANQARCQADELVKQDKWDAAVEQYDAVSKLASPGSLDHDYAKNKSAQLRVRIIQHDNVIEFSQNTSTDHDNFLSMLELQQGLLRLQLDFPESKKIKDTEKKFLHKKALIKLSFTGRINYAVTRYEQAKSLDGKKIIGDRLTQDIENGLIIWPEEQNWQRIWADIDSENLSLEKDFLLFQEAGQLINAGDENKCDQARTNLILLRGYITDPAYENLVITLRQKYEDFSDSASKNKQLNLVERFSAVIKEAPFNFYKSSDDFLLQYLRRKVNEEPDNAQRKYLLDMEIRRQDLLAQQANLRKMRDERETNIKKLVKQSEILFASMVITALFFAGLLAYVILITVNKNDWRTWIVPSLSPIITGVLSKFLYDQRININQRIDKDRKQLYDDIDRDLQKIENNLLDLDKEFHPKNDDDGT